MYMSDATHGNISTAISAQSVGIFKMKWSYNEYTNTSLQIAIWLVHFFISEYNLD